MLELNNIVKDYISGDTRVTALKGINLRFRDSEFVSILGQSGCGKTTMFNALTGANQYVGNWPGVTVEKKEGKLIGHKDVDLVDLPGIYSLSPYTLELF